MCVFTLLTSLQSAYAAVYTSLDLFARCVSHVGYKIVIKFSPPWSKFGMNQYRKGRFFFSPFSFLNQNLNSCAYDLINDMPPNRHTVNWRSKSVNLLVKQDQLKSFTSNKSAALTLATHKSSGKAWKKRIDFQNILTGALNHFHYLYKWWIWSLDQQVTTALRPPASRIPPS